MLWDKAPLRIPSIFQSSKLGFGSCWLLIGGKPQLFGPEEGNCTHAQSQLGNKKEEKERGKKGDKVKKRKKESKKEIMSTLGEGRCLS